MRKRHVSPAAGRLESMARSLVDEYPPELREEQLADVPRIAFHVGCVLDHVGPGGVVCDVGGGVGLFSVVCSAAGLRSILVDDFADPVNDALGERALDPHRAHGVEVLARDVIAEGLDLPPGSLDAATSFNALEHWHHSPRNLLRGMVEALRPGGMLLLGAPNRANARKRAALLVGRAPWSGFEEWYERDTFRGHVREPDVADLRRIAEDLGLGAVRVFGRNWMGLVSPRPAVRSLARAADPLLRRRPSLCSDIYVRGLKGPAPG